MRVFRDYDPLTGVTEEYHFDLNEDPEAFVKVDRQDIEGLLDHNRHLEDIQPDHACLLGPARRRHIADIPIIVYEELWRQGRTPAQDAPAFKKWLNAKDNEVFKVWNKTV